MATFDPNVPKEQAPVGAFWFRPGQQPIADTGMGKALESAAKGIREGVSAATELAGQAQEHELSRGTDQILDEEVGRLKPVYDSIMANNESNDFNVLSPTSGAQQVPAGLQRGLQAMDKVDAIMASGKYSPLYSQAQGTELLKRVRAEWPGFRQEVDEKANRLWGRGIANRSIDTMRNVINSYIGKKDELRNDTIKEARRMIASGYTELAPTLTKFMSGQMSEMDLNLAMGRINYQTTHLKNLELLRNADKAVQDDKTMLARRQADQSVGNKQYWFVHNMPINLFGAKHIDELPALMNSPNITQTQRTQIAQAITQYGQQFEQEMNAELDRRNIRTHRSLRMDLGEYDPVGNNKGFFTQMAKYINNKETGPLVVTAKGIEAKQEDATATLYNDPNLAAFALARHALEKIAPQSEFGKSIDSEMQRLNIPRQMVPFVAGLNNVLRAGVTPSQVQYIGPNKWDFDAQYDQLSPKTSIDPNKPVPTFKSNIEQVQAGMKAVGADENTTSKATAAVLNPVHDIGDTKVPAEVRHHVFIGLIGNRENEKMDFSMFGQDHTDPQGNPILGATSIYNLLTNPAVSKYAFTSKDVTPEERQKYKDLLTGEFAHNVFPKELTVMQKYFNDPNVKIGYDSAEHKFWVVPGRPEDEMQFAKVYGEASNAAARLNIGISNLKAMAKYTKQDPNEFVAQALQYVKGPLADQIRMGFQKQQQQSEQNDPNVQRR